MPTLSYILMEVFYKDSRTQEMDGKMRIDNESEE